MQKTGTDVIPAIFFTVLLSREAEDMNIGQLHELQTYLGKASLIYERPANSGNFYVKVGTCVIKLGVVDLKALMSHEMSTPNLRIVCSLLDNRVKNLKNKAMAHRSKHERGDNDRRNKGRDRQDSGNPRR